MPKNKPHICRTCRYAEWNQKQLTNHKPPRPQSWASGECGVQLIKGIREKMLAPFDLPNSIEVSLHFYKRTIRAVNGLECPCWKAKNG